MTSCELKYGHNNHLQEVRLQGVRRAEEVQQPSHRLWEEVEVEALLKNYLEKKSIFILRTDIRQKILPWGKAKLAPIKNKKMDNFKLIFLSKLLNN